MHPRNLRVRVIRFLLFLGLLGALLSGLLSLLPQREPHTLAGTPHSTTSLNQGSERTAFTLIARKALVPGTRQNPG